MTAPTKTAAIEAMAAVREELGQAPRSTKTYTVNEAVAAWLADGLPGRSERTKAVYRDGLAPLLAKIGHRPLREVTALEVRKGLESLSGQLSTRSLQIARNSLERALRFAQVHERVGRNVAELIEAPRGRTGRPSKSLTLAQAQALLKAAESARLYAYIVVSLLSGLRTEEVRALIWDHVVTWVDDTTGWQPVTELGFDDARASHAMFAILVWRADRTGGDVKTPRSRRSLRMPDLCVEALRRQRDQQQRDRLIAGEKWQENGLVFALQARRPQLNRGHRDGLQARAAAGDQVRRGRHRQTLPRLILRPRIGPKPRFWPQAGVTSANTCGPKSTTTSSVALHRQDAQRQPRRRLAASTGRHAAQSR